MPEPYYRTLEISRTGVFVHWIWRCLPLPPTGEIPRGRVEVSGVAHTRWGARRAAHRALRSVPGSML